MQHFMYLEIQRKLSVKKKKCMNMKQQKYGVRIRGKEYMALLILRLQRKKYHWLFLHMSLEIRIMWTATWALNTLVSRGKSTDWMVHMLGQAVGAYTDATHGMTLSAVSLPYYQYIMPYGLSRFCRFAVNVWEVNPAGKSDEQIAREGLSCMEGWMKELGLAMNLHELGVTEEMLDGITNGTIIMEGGYKVLNHDEVLNILKNSL